MRELEAGTLASEKDSANASLNLAVIPRETGGLIHISRAAFLMIAELFHIDPYVLHLASPGSASLHHDPKPYESSYTYYIGNFFYSLMLSFSANSMSTCGILLPRKNL